MRYEHIGDMFLHDVANSDSIPLVNKIVIMLKHIGQLKFLQDKGFVLSTDKPEM